MTLWPPLTRRTEPVIRRRIPLFHPVPVAHRADGWTPRRQGDFIGYLAEKRSVLEACRRVGMGREGAYRLRKRAGAAGFAAAWDAALGLPHARVDPASAKATGLDACKRFEAGLVEVVMHRGRFVASYCKSDENALMQHYSSLLRARRAADLARRNLRSLKTDRTQS